MHDTHIHQHSIPYCLAVTPCSLLRPPPPYFRAKLLYRVILPPLHAPPPRGRGRSSRYCSSCTCTRVASVEELYLCIKCVENSLRTGLGLFSLISDGFLRPSSCHRGRWAESGCETTCYVLQMYVANNSSILQYCHGMSIEGVLVYYRTTEYANSWGA